jgi:hypothetical protein
VLRAPRRHPSSGGGSRSGGASSGGQGRHIPRRPDPELRQGGVGSARGALGKLCNNRVWTPLSTRGRKGRRGESSGWTVMGL